MTEWLRMPTSRRSRKSSKASSSPNKRFDPAVLKRAGNIAAGYRLVLEPNDELGYIGSSVEIPTVFADGKTPDECVRATGEALTVAVATMLESGQRPPTSRAKRSTQVNIRLSPDEKFHLQDAAARLGFRGLSDFIRAVALDRSNVA